MRMLLVVTSSSSGGERGIRTPGTVTRTPHFECGPIDHSGISPFRSRPKLLFWDCKYRHNFCFCTSFDKNFCSLRQKCPCGGFRGRFLGPACPMTARARSANRQKEPVNPTVLRPTFRIFVRRSLGTRYPTAREWLGHLRQPRSLRTPVGSTGSLRMQYSAPISVYKGEAILKTV